MSHVENNRILGLFGKRASKKVYIKIKVSEVLKKEFLQRKFNGLYKSNCVYPRSYGIRYFTRSQ